MAAAAAAAALPSLAPQGHGCNPAKVISMIFIGNVIGLM